MSATPLSFDEIAARLKTAALNELSGINQVELFAARLESDQLRALTVTEVRRQAEALGAAHRIALAMARRPDLALGLMLSGADIEGLS